MRLYYRAINKSGKTVTGLIEARDIEEVAHYLRTHEFTPVTIVPAQNTGVNRFLPFLHTTSLKDLAFFTRQISSMLTSGLTLLQALNLMKNQMDNPYMTEIIQTTINDIENGKTFSIAIEKYPQTFTPVYIALVRTGESSGLMDKIFLRLAENIEKRDKLQRTIRGALIYPTIIVTLMIIVMIIMLIFVIPQLSSLYSSMSLSLPITTQVVVDTSQFFISYWYFAIVVIAVTVFILKRWYRNPSGRWIVDGMLLKLPIFGPLFKQVTMAEFTRTVSILIGSGALLVDSLIKSADVVGNVRYHEAIILTARRVEKGISLGDALQASPLFPQIVGELVRIGEQTGKLDDSLMKASEYFEGEVEQKVKTMTTLLEPVIMVILAFGVGFLIFAIITPIYSLISNIQ